MDAVLTASRSLVAVATMSLGAAAEDTTIAQYRALVVLASRGPQRMVDLAAELGVTPSTAGRMCDRLVRKGMIRRHRDRTDRRAVQVSLTGAGRQVVDQATARRRELIAGILAELPARQHRDRRALQAFARAAGEVPDSLWPPSRRGPSCRPAKKRTTMTATSREAARPAGPWTARAGGVAARLAAACSGRALVGAGAGLGAVAFRYLIYFVTWLATGHVQFGQQGRVPSAHLPWLGLGFFVVIPVIGGLIYGPLIYRYAREARGHGVPEVMIAVADEGGRVRPQVAAVKSVASAVCIGVGGSVGREGPIVQIGSALASSLGPVGEDAGEPAADPGRLRRGRRHRRHVQRADHRGVLRRGDHPAGIVSRGSVHGDAVCLDGRHRRRQFVGGAPFLSGLPAGISLHHLTTYLLIAVLAVVAALIGLAF